MTSDAPFVGGNRAGKSDTGRLSTSGNTTPALISKGGLASYSALPTTQTSDQASLPENVQYYSHHAKECRNSQQHKIDKFLEHHCIQYDQEKKVYYCLPIEGYNKTTYTIRKKDGELVCDCQYCQTKLRKGEDAMCSHIGALYEFWARGHKQRKEENVYAGIQMVLRV